MNIPGMKAKFATPSPVISAPIKLATAAEPVIIQAPPPKMAKHLQMQLPAEKLAPVRRVTESDLDELIVATVPLFKARYPRLEPESFHSYVRSNLYNNKCRVVRTDWAWGIAAYDQAFWEPKGWVEVIGVAKLKSTTTDALAVYLDLMQWAKNIGVAEFRMPQLAGYDLGPFAKRLEMSDRFVQYVKVF